jgi:hypothetical protein
MVELRKKEGNMGSSAQKIAPSYWRSTKTKENRDKIRIQHHQIVRRRQWKQNQ